MTKCSKLFVINIPLYNQDIIVSVNQSDVSFAKDVVNIGLTSIDDPSFKSVIEPFLNKETYTMARTAYYESTGAIALRIYDLDVLSIQGLSIVVHELSHVTSFIFERIGMAHNSHTDEAYSYLIGYITQKFYENV